MKQDKWKYFNLIFLSVLLVAVAAFVALGDGEEDGEMVQLDMSNGGTVVQEAPATETDGGPGVPLSGTDENMEPNASNEERTGMSTTWTIDVPGGGSREATPEEVYRLETQGIELAFAHVAPGEYSEVYGSVTGVPGEEYTVTLAGPGVVNTQPKTVTIGEDGYTRVTWRITQYGTYTATHNFAGDTSDIFQKKASIEVN